MNILIYDFINAYTQMDIGYYLEKAGHHCNFIHRDTKPRDEREVFEAEMEKEVAAANYDLVFTTNFWPEVSRVCNKVGLKYVSWFFDSPPNLETTECMDYSCNRIFFFTRGDYKTYKDMGLDNIYYLPLAVNTERLLAVKTDYDKYGSETSFVGRLYEDMLPAMLVHMDEYQQGYIDGVVKTQLQVYGEYLIDDAITEEFAESVRQRFLSLSDKAILPTRQQLAWQVATYVTHLERITLISILSKMTDFKLYTYNFGDNLRKMLPNVKECGKVSYIREMPQVFKASKINLCPILRANKTGIPLRALDIMGCGGFLLSGYQPELNEYFIDGQECVQYTSIEDAIAKADFYLKHEDLRQQIAAAGLARVQADFRYEDRITKLLEC